MKVEIRGHGETWTLWYENEEYIPSTHKVYNRAGILSGTIEASGGTSYHPSEPDSPRFVQAGIAPRRDGLFKVGTRTVGTLDECQTIASTFSDDITIIETAPSRRHSEGKAMEREVFVSDFTGNEIDAKNAVLVTAKFADGRTVVADAATGDDVVKLIVKVGRQQARRGRRPKAEAA